MFLSTKTPSIDALKNFNKHSSIKHIFSIVSYQKCFNLINLIKIVTSDSIVYYTNKKLIKRKKKERKETRLNEGKNNQSATTCSYFIHQ